MMDILVRPQELRQSAQQLRASAAKISNATSGVGNIVLGSALRLVFSGNRASALMKRYLSKASELASFDDLVMKFANDLEKAADIFEKMDKSGALSLDINNNHDVNLITHLQAGSVLGANSVANDTSSISTLVSNVKATEKAYEKWVEKNQKEIGGWTLEQVEQKIAEINKIIADTESGILDMKKFDWWNIFTQADEEYIKSSESNIIAYREILERYHTRRELLLEKTSLENRMNQAKNTLIRACTDRSIDDKATVGWLRNGMGGCTHYVAEKRDVSLFGGGHPGNAEKWDDQARAAGFDTGHLPIRGSIIVFEAGYDPDGAGGNRQPIGSAGHVGYVEKVVRVEGGYQIEFSQANTIYGSEFDGGWKRGAHTSPTVATKFIPDNGIDKISFIYDKP